jgi:oligopeptide/dipeptide ABC transporter ATP-binding protein
MGCAMPPTLTANIDAYRGDAFMTTTEKLLQVKDLKLQFETREGTVRAVDGVSFSLEAGQTLGIVGESGSGKSMTARALLSLIPPPGKIVGGEIWFNKRQTDVLNQATGWLDIAQLDPKGSAIRGVRGEEIAMIFQEPMTSLSPVHTIGKQIVATLRLHKGISHKEARKQAVGLLYKVEMPRPEQAVDSYPHQLSGGMRQRAMIALALSCNPRLLIADEPTTALDVTTEAQILDLMRQLQAEDGMAILFITHNLGVVAEIAQEMLVMYLGKVVEHADVDTIFHNPQHPYTRALLRSVPRLGARSGTRLQAISGAVPSPYALPSGCPFHPRCSERIDGVCDVIEPRAIPIADNHSVRCHLYDEHYTTA